jgi:hypothetical protein
VRNLLSVLLGVTLLAACGGGGSGQTTLSIQSKLAPVSAATSMVAWHWVRPSARPEVAPADGQMQEFCAAASAAGDDTPTVVTKGLKRGWLQYQVIEVTTSSIRQPGAEIIALDGGTVLEDYRRGSLVMPLFEVLLAASDQGKSVGSKCADWDFDGRLLLAIDRRVPFETVSLVLYTAMQAEFEHISFLVRDPRPTEAPTPAAGANLEAILVIADDGSIAVEHAGALDGAQAPGVNELGVALDTVLEARTNLGCAAVVPYLDVPWTLVAATLDQLAALGVGEPMIGLSGQGLAAPLPDSAPVEVELFEPTEILAVLSVAKPGGEVGRGSCSGPPIRPPEPPAPEEEPPAAE